MALALALIVIAVGTVAFQLLSPWWFTPLASNWGRLDDTILITLAITGGVFVAINLFIAWTLIRYRYRPDRQAHYEPENPKLERWLTGFTTVGIVAMLAPGLAVYSDMIHPPAGAGVFEALGQQWQWRFRLPGADGQLGRSDARFITADNPWGVDPNDPQGQDDVLIEAPELHLPVGKPEIALLRSRDVLHDFFVPQFRNKLDIVPGTVSRLWFTPTKAGAYDLLCAEYCGVGHANMRGRVVVEDEAQYAAWLAAQPTFAGHRPGSRDEGGADLSKLGQRLAQTRGCVACHSVDGSRGVGPSWQGLAGRHETLADGRTVTADEGYLQQSIRDPGAAVVKGYAAVMPKVELSDHEVEALVAYIGSLKAPAGDRAGP